MTLSPDQHRRVRALFDELQAQPAALRRAAVAAACVGDPELEAEVSRLLSASAHAGSFLEHGAAKALTGASAVGRCIGAYEIRGVLGIGGMGEVYLARDRVLGRDVALKLLPAPWAGDPDRVGRLRREAQILASLNHPQIAGLYGLDESDGTPALVMELVEGPTLADRIDQGPLPLDEARLVARQIAGALEAAHRAGIVHRDLKPANIKVRHDGTVKVLDFGLAKALDPTPIAALSPSDVPAASPTVAGTILGTTAYMSPEQAKGRPVDKRSDIWAFGCLLFEMLAGRPAFDGEDPADIVAAVLTKEPEWNRLPPSTPLAVRRLLRRCLEKSRDRRLADVADARLELDESADEIAPAPPERRPAVARWAPWAIAAASLVAASWLGGRQRIDQPVAVSRSYRASLLLPGSLGAARTANGPKVALSMDGRRLALVASDSTGHSRLWLRSLDGPRFQPLEGTVDAESPFWSPDGRSLGFVQNRALKGIDTSTGRVWTMCEEALAGGSWNADGVILFTVRGGSIARVPANGGTPVPLTTITGNNGEAFNEWPSFLPDGRTFLYVSLGLGSVHAHVYLASIDGVVPQTLLPLEAVGVQYAAGFLWFLRGSTLVAQPIDLDRRALSGPEVQIAEEVRIDNAAFRSGVFSVAASGTLVYQEDPAPGYELTWYDRTGRALGRLGERADYADPQVSPDGTRVLVSVAPAGTATRDLYIFDVARSVRTRFTFEDSRPIRTPIWSPDGRRIAFASERQGHVVLMQKDASGVGEAKVLFDDPFDKEPVSWSPDGRYVFYVRRSTINDPRAWVLPLGGQPFELAHPRAVFPQVSPDGRWILYVSRESGRVEVYVAPFPGPGTSVQVSTAGGFNARWRPDGKEIFYLYPPDNTLRAAAVRLERDRVDVGATQTLFELPWIGPRQSYDVLPDGQRILALTQRSQTTASPLTLIVNWPALVRP